MKILALFIAAAVVLGIAGIGISNYGKARYDDGWTEATQAQTDAAAKEQEQAGRDKAESARQLAALRDELARRMSEIDDLKMEALAKDEEYKRWRAISLPAVTRCRLWNLCPAK